MDSRHGKVRMKVEGDRLSTLPDDLIHKILSFIDIKHAIRTSALSSRWRYIWTSMPCLSFSNEHFHSLPEFSEFVTHVLSARNNQTEVHSVKLAFRGKASQPFVKRILNYAFSHNVQQLNITFLHEDYMTKTYLSAFSSQSLKNLTLSRCGCACEDFITTSPSWYLPALTTLNLHHCSFFGEKYPGLFSKCANLKNLTLKNFNTMKFHGFNIIHPRLSSLTLEDGCIDVNVATPQLKNLTVINWSRMHLVDAPDLASLHYKDHYGKLLKFSTELRHLEKLRSVKFLTLNLELVKCLSSSVELISHQPSPFTNLKSLKIYPADVSKPEVTMYTEVKNYLLGSSQGATFTLVSYEEVRAVMDVTSARNLMTKLKVLLDQWQEYSETKMAHIEQDEAPMETVHEQVKVEEQTDTKMKWHFGGRMAQIKSYWGDLNDQCEKASNNMGLISSMLQETIEVMTRLPTSHQAKLQERFFGLSAEAETIMEGVMDRMKILFDKRPSHSNVYFHELAASQSLS
ncbi:putative F-box domain, leucine-rich repeat domain superfamily, F-box-like domain superfamily [Helianthus annuus]|nr:putative F-box domain, leucine-rich repeat domain superfamily, F-box-like domain superfamily [Helianthus annuus]